jgi:hypothetical protein
MLSKCNRLYDGCFEANEHIDAEQVAKIAFQQLLVSNHTEPVDQERWRAVSAPEAGDWFHAPPLTAVDLRLFNEAMPITVDYHLETAACQPQTCPRESAIDARGLHALSRKKCGPRLIELAALNEKNN